MRVAYVTLFDATDVNNWSGTDLHIWQALQKQGIKIELIGNLRHGASVRRRMRRLWGTRVERRAYLPLWNMQTAKGYAADAAARIQTLNVDAVVSPSPIPLAFLRCTQPKLLWTDANFSGLSLLYDEFNPARLCSASVNDARRIERAVSANCDKLVYASDWGASQAIAAGHAPPAKVAVVPFGANLEVQHTGGDAVAFSAARTIDHVKLLFIGVHWQRKGADKAIAVVRELRTRGIMADLTIVGCQPPEGFDLPDFVECLGFISKQTPDGRERIESLYRQSHFLIVPTVAEAYGLVFAEASAFGLPSLSHRVGGIPTIIRDDVNGRLFDPSEPVSAWARWVVEQLRTPGRMARFAADCYAEYAARLNWDVAGRAFAKLLRQTVAEKQPCTRH